MSGLCGDPQSDVSNSMLSILLRLIKKVQIIIMYIIMRMMQIQPWKDRMKGKDKLLSKKRVTEICCM